MSAIERLMWLAVVVMSWVFFCLSWPRTSRDWEGQTPDEVDQWIKQELPLGTSRTRVVRFLDLQGIERYWREDDESSSPSRDELLAIIRGVNGGSHFLI